MKPRTLVTALAFAVPVIGLLELGGYFHFANRAPSPEAWEQARPAVHEAYQPGDVVVVAPRWAEPIARWKLGGEVFPLREVARPDVTRYARAIEVSSMGARSPELEGWPVDKESHVGKLVVRTLRNPVPPTVTFDFTDHLGPSRAEVEFTKKGRTQPCRYNARAPIETRGYYSPPPFPAQRYQCDDGPEHFIGVTVIQDDRALPRRCIFAPPPGDGGETILRYRDVPLGKVIRGHLGIQWIMERDRLGSPTTLRVRVDGEDVGQAVHEDGEGWKPFELALGSHAGKEKATVELRVTAPERKERHLCFEADSR